jgi:hypothetical protein
MSIVRRATLAVTLGLIALAFPATALACELYTFSDEDDWFQLSDGVQWAFVGDVVEEMTTSEIPDQPVAVVLSVRERIAGSVALRRLRIEQDPGCDPFWYRKGDQVVAAIGLRPDLRPPFEGVTNYAVAVWVIRDGTVIRRDGPHSRPWIGNRAPRTESELRAMLLALPDTAVEGRDAGTSETLPVFLAAGLVLGAMVGRRMLTRGPRAPLRRDLLP